MQRQDLIALFCERSSRPECKGDFLRKQGHKVDTHYVVAFLKNLPCTRGIAAQKKGLF
jgi:hypothetical protein